MSGFELLFGEACVLPLLGNDLPGETPTVMPNLGGVHSVVPILSEETETFIWSQGGSCEENEGFQWSVEVVSLSLLTACMAECALSHAEITCAHAVTSSLEL